MLAPLLKVFADIVISYTQEMRLQLQEAISRRLIAEHIMKDESAVIDNSMTEAEDAYLEAMEEVNIISRKLEGAERAFSMVRGEIEALVNEYEDLLYQVDGDETSESHSNSDDRVIKKNLSLNIESIEKLTQRAQNAEIEARKAKLEAEKSKQEVERIRSQKEQELLMLQVCAQI